jgi:DNA-binding SARP family transcriptional activator
MNGAPTRFSHEPLLISILRGVAEFAGTTVALTQRDLELVFTLPPDGRCVASATLANALWPEAEPSDALNALHVAVHRLRARVRDAGSIRRERFGYRLGPHVRCDLHEIAAAVRASSARGALGEAERLRLTEAYERLRASQPSRGSCSAASAAIEARVSELLRTIVERTARHELANGGYDRALDLATGAIERDACDESAFEIAIRAHLGMRNRAEALLAYRTYARALECELDVAPSPRLRELVAR